jgi:hypothetical protein
MSGGDKFQLVSRAGLYIAKKEPAFFIGVCFSVFLLTNLTSVFSRGPSELLTTPLGPSLQVHEIHGNPS